MKKAIFTLLFFFWVANTQVFWADDYSCPIIETPSNIVEYQKLIKKDLKIITEEIIDERAVAKSEYEWAWMINKELLDVKYNARILKNKVFQWYKSINSWISGASTDIWIWINWALREIPDEIIRDYKKLDATSEKIKELIDYHGSIWDDILMKVKRWWHSISLFRLLEKNEEIKRNLSRIVIRKIKSRFSEVWDIKYTIDYYWFLVSLREYESAVTFCTLPKWTIKEWIERISWMWENYNAPLEEWIEAKDMLHNSMYWTSTWERRAAMKEEKRLLQEYLDEEWYSEGQTQNILSNLDAANKQLWTASYTHTDRIVAKDENQSAKHLRRVYENFLKSAWELWSSIYNNINQDEQIIDDLLSSESDDWSPLKILSFDKKNKEIEKERLIESVKNEVRIYYDANKLYLSWNERDKDQMINEILNLHITISGTIDKLSELEKRWVKICKSQDAARWICEALKRN